MKSAQDGFAFVADCYGKGMFKERKVEETSPPVESAEEEFDEDTIPIQTLDL